jgi:hypothetical protein
MVRAFITALALAIVAGSPISSASAQINPQTGADLRALETRLQSRFQVLPIANGVVLTPKFKTTIRSVEVTDNAIAIDGAVVTGAELRDKLGADSNLIFQLSYLDSASRRSLLGLGGTAVPVQPPAAAPAPGTNQAAPESPGPTRAKRRDDIVRFGGSIVVDEDETVSGDVAVIGGSAVVNGQVQGEVAVIGGSLTLGPKADVFRDVTVVGGALNKDPGAVIRGKVSEVGIGDAIRGSRVQDRVQERMGRARFWRDFGLSPFIGFAGTLVRVALVILLAGIVLLVARAPVQEIADRAAAEPFKSWAVGFLAEILFVPVLVLTVVVLAVSIIGIPLLLLVPVAVVGIMVVSLVGFTGVAYHIGRLIEGRFEQVRNKPYLATILGICVIVSPLVLARVVGLVDGLGMVTGILMAAGFVIEYLAWTTGLGAAALARFAKPAPQPLPLPPPQPQV